MGYRVWTGLAHGTVAYRLCGSRKESSYIHSSHIVLGHILFLVHGIKADGLAGVVWDYRRCGSRDKEQGSGAGRYDIIQGQGWILPPGIYTARPTEIIVS
jgi:hypothetical protein